MRRSLTCRGARAAGADEAAFVLRRPTDEPLQPLAVQAPFTHCEHSLPWPQLDHIGLDAEARAVWAHQQSLARAARPPAVLPVAVALLSLVGAALVAASRSGATSTRPADSPVAVRDRSVGFSSSAAPVQVVDKQ
ncbi:MAG: hypothetical protein FJ100_13370 [Deltaproteobacteria bacterium]|nr:hypothetical protein [Deltaproteobacteria bacterium]